MARRDQSRLGGRQLHTKVKTARGRKNSSTLWLQRQLNDPYVAAAGREGYRARSAFKLIELDDRCKLLKPNLKILDLGAAPGGWTQVAVEKTGSDKQGSLARVVSADILEIEPHPGAVNLVIDILEEDAPARLTEALGGQADLVLSDMAPNFSGHGGTDKLRTLALVEAAAELAFDVLALEGGFVAKVFRGGTEQELLKEIKKRFKSVKHVKPPASRSDSAEIYLVAQGFRGNPE